MTAQSVCVAMLGAGTVGRAVAEAIRDHPERLLTDDGAVIRLTGIAVRNLDRARAAGIGSDLLTDAPAHLV